MAEDEWEDFGAKLLFGDCQFGKFTLFFLSEYEKYAQIHEGWGALF